MDAPAAPAEQGPDAPAAAPGPCPECGEPVAAGVDRCPACGARLRRPSSDRISRLRDLGPPPPRPGLLDRVAGVLLTPGATFKAHDPSWGWAGMWLLVAAAGVLYGALYLARVDLAAKAERDLERTFEAMTPEQRRAIDGNPQVMDQGQRAGLFFQKAGAIAGPPILGLVDLVYWGAVVFGASWALGSRRPDFMRSISLVAHLQAVDLVQYAALSVGVLSGNDTPQTSPAFLFADPFRAPALAAALSRLDPLLLTWYALLAIGLQASCRLRPARAWGVAVGLYLLGSSALVGMVAAGQAMGRMAHGGT